MNTRILVVRLGAMGDVIHALPAAASLKQSFPRCFLAWAIEPRWMPLLEGNPYLDEVMPVDRTSWRSLLALRRRLRAAKFDFAVDLQGLIKSALIASAARPERIYGFHRTQVREKAAALIYSNPVKTTCGHVVEKNLEVVQAAGANNPVRSFALPPGQPENDLPASPFVLANPSAGWTGKQWPLGRYAELGRRLRFECGVELVLNGVRMEGVPNTTPHSSGLAGLIDATRRATAVVGVDSGPLHLAAALGKPGVAIFGPTDPARNGPFGNSFTVLRSPHAVTSYKRRETHDPSILEVTVDEVFAALKARLT
jgi:heptosyltransferase I